jgi:Predicted transcriptional regulators
MYYNHKYKQMIKFGGEKVRIDRIKLVTELTRQDLTQKRLAELSGVSRATINYIRSGKSCTDEIGNKIAKALNVPIETLLEN